MVERPRIASAKYSAGQNLSASFASGPEKRIRMNIPIKPPATDAIRDTPSPVPAWPLRVSGYPSKAVTTADGVPGVLIITAVMDPP